MLRKRIQQARRLATNQPQKIHAIHDDDLEKFLAAIGLLNSLKAGKLKCKFCDAIVTLESIYSIFPDSGNISLVCNKEQCKYSFLEYRGK
jgi:hypothetical protein